MEYPYIILPASRKHPTSVLSKVPFLHKLGCQPDLDLADFERPDCHIGHYAPNEPNRASVKLAGPYKDHILQILSISIQIFRKFRIHKNPNPMKQIGGLCYPLVKTIDDLVFYKLCDEYYARKKSSLSSERVKTSPEFRRTMVHANLLARASKIGAQVYKALPPGWRQFWMYRSFTGEAFILLQDNPYDDEAVKQLLWKCYVEYWEQRKLIDPDNSIFQPKPKKIRKPRKYSDESIQRMLKRKGKDGKPKWIDPEEEERKRLHKEMNAACYARTMEKQRRLAEEQLRAEEKLRASSFEPRTAVATEQVLEQEDKAVPALLLRRAKGPGIVLRGCKSRRATATRIVRLLRWGQRPCNSLTRRRRANERIFSVSVPHTVGVTMTRAGPLKDRLVSYMDAILC